MSQESASTARDWIARPSLLRCPTHVAPDPYVTHVVPYVGGEQ